MSTFFKSRGYPSDLLQNAQERVSSITRQEALKKHVRENEGRIPLVLIYHPLTSRVKHILLNNFNILTTDPATATIFPAPPVVAHRHDLSLWDVLIHTSDRNQTEEPGTVFAWRHPRCCTCLYTSSNIHVCRPKSSTTIRECFTCKSENAVYCISCHRCYTSERRVKIFANDSANISRALKKNTQVVSRSQSTLSLSVIVYQTCCKRPKEVFWCQFQTEAVRNGNHF